MLRPSMRPSADDEPLDTDEQEEIVDGLERSHRRSTACLTYAAAAACACFGLLKLYLCASALGSHRAGLWDTQCSRHPHAALAASMGAPAAAALELLSSAAFVFVGAAVAFVRPLEDAQRTVRRATVAAAAAALAVGAATMDAWAAAWLLGVNAGVGLLLEYVVADLLRTGQDVRALRGLEYKFKKP
eukprot:m51a1_g4309 hypothetical protein (187) ;mRNA; f:38847-39485